MVPAATYGPGGSAWGDVVRLWPPPVEPTEVPFDLDMDRRPNALERSILQHNHEEATDQEPQGEGLRRTEPPGLSQRLAVLLQCPTCQVYVRGMSRYRSHRAETHDDVHVIPHQIRG